MTSLLICSLLGAIMGVALAVHLHAREPHSPARAALLGLLYAGAAECLLVAIIASPLGHGSTLLFLQRLRLLAAALLPGPLLQFCLAYGRGDAPEVLRQWRLWIRAAYLLPPLALVAMWPESIILVRMGETTSTLALRLGTGGKVVEIAFMVLGVLALMNLERTLRVSVGTMRWRIKYTVLGIGTFVVARVATSSQELLHATVMPSWFMINGLAFSITCLLLWFSRRRGNLLSVDLYPSQRVLYQTVTLGLAGLYLLIIGVLAVVGGWIGVNAWLPLNSILVLVAILGAAMLLLSDRIRQGAKQWVSLHFRRPQHDYRRVWSRFTERTSALTDVDAFCRATVRLVADTFEALSVSIWLAGADERRLHLSASTVLGDHEPGPHSPPDPVDSLADIRDLDGPIDLNRCRALWAADLRQAHPESFHTGQTLCVPLKTGDHILGLILIGDRVNHAPFTTEDHALLKTIGEHTADRLLTFRLSDRLLEAREFEALQNVSAFFVHDLKNTATTLSLMLKNLSRHFDNPEFREDALQTIGTTVQRIENMIRQLTLLRDEQQLDRTSTDLSALVETVIGETQDPSAGTIELALADLPPTPLDAKKLRTVITNLVMNAREACGAGGKIHVQTAREGHALVLTLRDDGAGMSQEFIERRLFKPFQSTKPNGLGIGLYHSKQIVDAHGGRMEVESEPGNGTAFRVILPLKEEGVRDDKDPDCG